MNTIIVAQTFRKCYAKWDTEAGNSENIVDTGSSNDQGGDAFVEAVASVRQVEEGRNNHCRGDGRQHKPVVKYD